MKVLKIAFKHQKTLIPLNDLVFQIGSRGGACELPNASKRATTSKLAHKWMDRLHITCRLGGSQRFGAGGKIRIGPQVGRLAKQPWPFGRSPTLQSGGPNQNWPASTQIGYITPATRGSRTFPNGGQNQNCPTTTWNGGITLAVGGGGVPNASEWQTKSDLANWLQKLSHMGIPNALTGDNMRYGPQLRALAT